MHDPKFFFSFSQTTEERKRKEKKEKEERKRKIRCEHMKNVWCQKDRYANSTQRQFRVQTWVGRISSIVIKVVHQFSTLIISRLCEGMLGQMALLRKISWGWIFDQWSWEICARRVDGVMEVCGQCNLIN